MYYCTCVCFYLLGLFFPSLLQLFCRLVHGSVFISRLPGEGWVQMVAPFFLFVPSPVSWLQRWGYNQSNHFSCASAYCPEDIFLNHWRFCHQTLCDGASPLTMLSYEIECLGQLSSKPRSWWGVRLLKYGCLSHVVWDTLFKKRKEKRKTASGGAASWARVLGEFFVMLLSVSRSLRIAICILGESLFTLPCLNRWTLCYYPSSFRDYLHCLNLYLLSCLVNCL